MTHGAGIAPDPDCAVAAVPQAVPAETQAGRDDTLESLARRAFPAVRWIPPD